MGQRRKSARVLGPYQHGNRWRVIVVREGGREAPSSYETEAEALEVIAAIKAKLGDASGTKVEDVIEAYTKYLREDKEDKASHVGTTDQRLRKFFSPVLTRDIRGVSPTRCQALYDALRVGLAADTHQNILGQVKTFLAWAVKRKYVTKNAAEGIEAMGRRSKGKLQLRVDEARPFEAAAYELADAGNDAGVAVLLGLILGLRPSEIVSRVVRDVDDDGRLLWIDEGKTDASSRCLMVQDERLAMRLLRLTAGKLPAAPLFRSQNREWVLDWTKRLCRKAGVPVVTAHGLRGTFGTQFVRTSGGDVAGAAAALGHAGTGVTRASYVQPGAEADARTERALRVLQGGVK